MSNQKTFNFQNIKNFTNDNFIVSKSNYLVHKVLFNKSKPQKYLYLKGPSKSGKSHLGNIWQNLNDALKVNSKGIKYFNNFKKNIYIDNYTPKYNEEHLLHLVNHCYSNNLKILINSQFNISDINYNLSDLSSRLKSFYFIEITDPDDDLIINLLLKLLYDRQIVISNDEILPFIFKRINRTYLDIYNFIDKLDKLSLSKKRQITIPLIKELI